MFNASLEGGQNLVFKKLLSHRFRGRHAQRPGRAGDRDADKKDVFADRARSPSSPKRPATGKLTGTEMQGGTFTISSLGGIGGTAFTPIINSPEVAILGVSRVDA